MNDLTILGWYIGMAILVSLQLPAHVRKPNGDLFEVTAVVRVLVGLTWPLYYVLRIFNKVM